jgi:hypothetical protein
MSENPTTTTAGPWRILVLDRDTADPKLILATVAAPADVEPWPAGCDPETATGWLLTRTGLPAVTLTAMPGAQVWRVEPEDGAR